ncbi:MAG: hypothetical protein CME36_21260 [unclassified Hahellaceae]|nr:hypothetical protein [Hahellaceae bacterium]|tara:strand:- start:3889 stop:4242 length:354 start_codon:yes stop_codon:yes gene_type:complete
MSFKFHTRIVYGLCLLGLGAAGTVYAEESSVDSEDSCVCESSAHEGVSAHKSVAVIDNWKPVFADYEAFNEQPVLSWERLNERVGEIGGWRVYAMEPYEDDEEMSSEEMPSDGGDHQ